MKKGYCPISLHDCSDGCALFLENECSIVTVAKNLKEIKELEKGKGVQVNFNPPPISVIGGFPDD